jgi:serine phosphatase RsbU (regulator of sigma subunit)
MTLLLVLLSNPLFAQETIILDDTCDKYPLGRHLGILEDKEDKWTIEDVTSAEFSQKFAPSRQERPNFGFTDSAYWALFHLKNNVTTDQKWLLEFNYPSIDHVNLYILDSSGKLIIKKEGGDLFPFRQREVKYRNLVFHLPIQSYSSQTIYLHLKSKGSMQFPLTIWSSTSFSDKVIIEYYLLGIYYGIMIVMVLYNLFIYLGVKDRIYLYYALFITAFIFFQMSLNGLAYQYLWPNSVSWANKCVPFFITLTLFGGFQYTKTFLNISRDIPKLYLTLSFAMSVIASAIVLSLIADYAVTIRLGVLLSIFTVASILAIGIKRVFDGYRPARYFLAAWLVLILGVIVLALKSLGIIPSLFLTDYGHSIGSVFGVILLSLGLTYRINEIEREKQKLAEEMEYARKEMAAARGMQLSLLPQSMPEIEGFDIAGVCEPATEVGGDYFNCLCLDEAQSKLDIVLMDVTGHGMKAATNTFLANGMLQSEIYSGTPPEQIMTKMNQSLCATLQKSTFVAMSLSVIDTEEKTLTHFNAGIPKPTIIRNGEVVDFEIPGELPLGCFPGSEYTGAVILLQSGDLLIFHSDGILEATNETGEMYEDERFVTFLTTLDVQTKSAQDMTNEILTDVRTFLFDEEEGDDMTVVVARVL